MNVEQIQALIIRLRKLVPAQGQWTTLAESACKDAADALEKLLPREQTPTESLAFDYAIAEVNRKLGVTVKPAAPEPDCINCGLPVDPSCYCARGRKLNEPQKSE